MQINVSVFCILRRNEQTVYSIRVISGVVSRRLLLRELTFLLPARWVLVRYPSLYAFVTPFWKEHAFAFVSRRARVAFERNREGLRSFLDRANPGWGLREVIWSRLLLLRGIMSTEKGASS